MIRLLLLAVMLAPIALSLAACGKVGPNAPPGPADQVITNRLQYPAQ
jgi:predicted small lipoprotein YifL